MRLQCHYSTGADNSRSSAHCRIFFTIPSASRSILFCWVWSRNCAHRVISDALPLSLFIIVMICILHDVMLSLSCCTPAWGTCLFTCTVEEMTWGSVKRRLRQPTCYTSYTQNELPSDILLATKCRSHLKSCNCVRATDMIYRIN